MARQKAKTGGFAARLDKSVKAAFESHKTDETRMGFGGKLPGGIQSGVARLVKSYLGEYKTGDYQGEIYLYLSGIALTPKYHVNEEGEKIPVKGSYTQVMVPMCDTQNAKGETRTTDENVDVALNELRKLGLDLSELEAEDLDEALAALQEAQPYFKYSTTQGKATEQFPNPRVFENWNGLIEDYEEDSDSDEVEEEDDEEEAPKSKGKSQPVKRKQAKPSYEEEAEEEEEESEEEEDEESEEAEEEEEGEEDDYEDLDALAKSADRDDRKAQLALVKIAKGYDIDEEDYPSWSEVVDAIKEARKTVSDEEEEEEGEEEEETEEVSFEKGDIVFYKPKGKRKAVECEVTAVFEKKQTCNLRNADDGTLYKPVPWSEITTDVD